MILKKFNKIANSKTGLTLFIELPSDNSSLTPSSQVEKHVLQMREPQQTAW